MERGDAVLVATYTLKGGGWWCCRWAAGWLNAHSPRGLPTGLVGKPSSEAPQKTKGEVILKIILSQSYGVG